MDPVSVKTGDGQGSGAGPESVRGLLGWLSRERLRARAVLVGSKLATLIGAVIGAAVLVGLIDYALRFPSWFRAVLWIGGVGAAAWYAVSRVAPAARFCPSLTDVALRVERLVPALKDKLASAVDFARRGDASRIDGGVGAMGHALAQKVVERTSEEWTRLGSRARLVSPRPLLHRSGWFAVALTACIALLAASPGLWAIGAARVLSPWAGVSWPKRTAVVDATNERVHALGMALPLRAVVTRTPWSWDGTTVGVRYRVITDGETGPTRRELLTWQRREAEAGDGETGGLFERLIEPSGEAVEYLFETEDDETEWARVRLVEPPAVRSAEAVITAPSYAAALVGAEGEGIEAPASGPIDLGPGTDERAVPAPALAGSRVELKITLNRELPVPESVRSEFMDPESAGESDVVIAQDGPVWRIAWTLDQSVRLPIRLVDADGIESVEEAVYRFEATADRPAAATITEPASDRTVLPTAIVRVTGEGRDDVGLEWVAVERELWRPAGAGEGRSGPGGAMERVGEPSVLVREEGDARSLVRVTMEMDLSTMELKSGDEVRLTAVAVDLLAAMAPSGEPTRSAVRTLRIISESDLIAEVQRELSEVRQSAIRIEDQQGQLRERTETGRTDATARRGQAQVGERLARQREQIDRLLERLMENRLDDRGLDELLRGAGESVDRAGEASQRAAQAIDEAAAEQGARGGEPGGEQEGAEPSDEEREAREQASRAQEEVQDRLRELIEMLDRGEDNWVVRNSIERLIREQQELREQTAQIGQQTAGREAQDLTSAERSELERIAERQNRLAQETENLADDMRQREDTLSEKDPAAASAMRQAAQRAEREQVAQTMRQAGQEAGRNQTQRAQGRQQQAQEALEEMLEDLDAGDRARDERLRRMLATLIESLEGLIAQQAEQIALLDVRIREDAGFAGLDQGMILLNRNTLGVLDAARAGGPELGPVVTLIGRASDAQVEAIDGLRFPLVIDKQVRGAEARSLELLREAKDRAEEIDERAAERERDRKTQEIRKKYREILEEQVAVRRETTPLAEAPELSRRDRVLARGLSERQAEVGARLKAVVAETAELQAATVFEYAHRRLDALSLKAEESLGGALPKEALPAQAGVERGIRDLLDAIAEPKPDPTKFREGAQASGGGGGGGGGGQQPLIPPVKELKLLRLLQSDIALRTREASDLGEAADRAMLNDLGQDQRSLMEVGQAFLDKMEQQQQGGGVSRPEDGPAEPAVPEEEGPDAGQEAPDESE